MKYTHIVLITAMLAACTKSKETKLDEIAALSRSEAMGKPEGLAKLAQLHKDYGSAYDDAQANEYLYSAGQYYFYENNLEEAKPLLNLYISRDDSTDRFRNAAINLATAYRKDSNFVAADELVSAVLDKSIPTPAQWQDVIKIYEEKIQANSDIRPKDYEQLSLSYTAVGRFSDATTSLDQAINDFPAYAKRANLIYRAGFVCWEYARDTKKARDFYEKFLTEYPRDERAPEVKQILNTGMLEMSDQAILEMLKASVK